MRKTLIVLLATCLPALPALASAQAVQSKGVQLTVYPEASGLFTPGHYGGSGGYAMVHEARRFVLKAGTQSLRLDGLAERIDPTALLLQFAPDSGVRVDGLRYLAPVHGASAALQQAIGQPVQVRSDSGVLLASGTLRAVEGSRLLVQDAQGALQLVSGNVTLPASLHLAPPGQQATVDIDAPRTGDYAAELVYPTAGLGWRAGYTLVLRAGDSCSGTLEAHATLANHSGTDFEAARVTLLAGAIRAPMPASPMPGVRMMATEAAPALPKQGAMADYRSYRLAKPLDLPDGAVLQVPLYAPQTLTCTHDYVWGDATAPGWSPQLPNFNPGDRRTEQGNPRIEIAFKAPENLPAGEVRTYRPDAGGSLQFTGAAGIGNLRKGDKAVLVPGDAYDLKIERERTRWQLAGTVLTEGLRYMLSNTGEHARTVTVYDHPHRWHEWQLLDSSPRPARQTADTLMWRVTVPPGGSVRVDYTLRYTAHLAAPAVLQPQ